MDNYNEYDEMAYKKAKEDWVTGHEGGSMWEINSVSGVVLTSYILWAAAAKHTNIFKYSTSSIINLFLEYVLIVLPSLLACTLLADYAFYLNVLLLILTGFIIKNSSIPEDQKPQKKKKKWDKDSDDEDEKLEQLLVKGDTSDPESSGINSDNLGKKPFLSVYRSSMILLTCIAILAVDFPVFPRRFAKVESFGASLMDLGVGSFVFSSGIISAKPFLKRPENRFKPFKGQLVRAFRRSLPLLALGFIRMMMVKGVDYQEHVSEYGKHWNFFFTLGLLPILVTICRTVQKYTRFSFVGLAVAFFYQIALSWFGLQDYIQYAPRTNLVSANKEGIFSLWGYLSIFLLALDVGHYVLPLDPYYAFRPNRKHVKRPKQDKLLMLLFSWAILSWIGFIFSLALQIEVSRQMANLSYILWVVTFNTTVLSMYQTIEMVFFFNYWKTDEKAMPKIFEAINSNGLLMFLLANILTGIVNLSIRTLYVNNLVAEGILAVYMLIISAAAMLFLDNGIKIGL
ncbi:7672_t:CDS:2 [Acaulospora morrowiae]|uniref:GPI-anchored wall transfer protein n=1 Tax=Acaulospora morrowiae TaxID=94023 RepID=A0A9N8Z860_9GLOM|nr:7672_t:CDS:2 [Acaulospora morrowiae]